MSAAASSAPAARARFDGAATWDQLDDAAKARIGAAALEAVIADFGYELASEPREARAFAAASELCFGVLTDVVMAALPELDELLASDQASAARVPLPLSLGPVCRLCGCSQNDACGFGCSWADDDLCSACEGAPS